MLKGCAVTVPLLSVMLGSSPHALAGQDTSASSPVVVTVGEGRVLATPDRAFVTLTTEARAKTPAEAQGLNAKAMASVQEKLLQARIPKDAIRTTSYDLQQDYDYVNGRQVSRGFVARHSIEARVEPIARAGEIIDLAVQAGATAAGGVRFDVKDRAKLERQALAEAVADARARAEAAAAGAGRTIDRVVRIQEDRVREPILPPVPMMMSRVAEADRPPTPVAPGQLEIRASVTLTASIK